MFCSVVFVADPAVYMTKRSIYAAENSSAVIRAAVSTSFSNPEVRWHHEDNKIDIAKDTRYSIRAERTDLYSLIIRRVDSTVLGRYDVLVIAGETFRTGVTELAYSGIIIIIDSGK
jgi:hypothetical protein